MKLFVVVLNCIWIISLAWVIRKDVWIVENKLSAQVILVTVAFAGLNMLMALMLIFDLMESTPDGLVKTMISQKATMGWLIFYAAGFTLNFLFGIRLVIKAINLEYT